ncbi:MAG TPA: hypothetical protein VF263_24570 [Longimicrobiaceae bacterium]
MNSVAPSRRESARSPSASPAARAKPWLPARGLCPAARGRSAGISRSGGAPARRSRQ